MHLCWWRGASSAGERRGAGCVPPSGTRSFKPGRVALLGVEARPKPPEKLGGADAALPPLKLRCHLEKSMLASDGTRTRVDVRARRQHVAEHGHNARLRRVGHCLVQRPLQVLEDQPWRGGVVGGADTLHDARVAQRRKHRDLAPQLGEDLGAVGVVARLGGGVDGW
eukprot:scaffold20095_cov62-Phaeocystis_antarctica.AAC.1